MNMHLHIITRRNLPSPATLPLLALPLVLLMAVTPAANAQTYPIPFASTVAGLAAGSGNANCTAGYIANYKGTNTGDGCVPTQATLTALYDVQVDAYGNLYTSENGTNDDIRIVYNGGKSAAALIVAANANTSLTAPVPGRIYTLAGGLTGAITAKNGSNYYCGNVTGGTQTNNSRGDFCPAAQAYIKPRGIAIDRYGNVFLTTNGGGNYIRVVYNGGTAVANLIIAENVGSTYVNSSNPPKVGYIYTIAGTSSTSTYVGDGGPASAATFVQLRYLAVDSQDNIYISDATTGGGTTQASENAVRMIDGADCATSPTGSSANGTCGYIKSVVGETACSGNYNGACPAGNAGSGVPAYGALLNSPYAIFVDSSDNLYLADYYNGLLRVVYNTKGSTIPGLGSNLTVGDLYTVAGGGATATTAAGTPALSLKFTTMLIAGIDHAGNLYVQDGTSKAIWRIDAKTALGTIVAGGGTATAGAVCASNETQKSSDNFGDGCPATQAVLASIGTITFDPQGNFYAAENGNGIVREMSYNLNFPSVTLGNTATQTLAFEVPTATGVPSASNTLNGAATTDYTTTVGATCTATGAAASYNICLANVTFNPQHDGQRPGSISVPATGTGNATEYLSGIGQGSDLAIDTGTQSTVGTGLTPVGVAADNNGNLYVSDTKSNSVLSGAATGTTLTPLVTGLNNPTGVAVDGQGNVYIANTGSNTVREVSKTGTAIATLGSGLSSPQGVAVDGAGNIYVADTGNNRIVQVYPNGYQVTVPVNNSLSAQSITTLSAPKQLAVDQNGVLYIVDSGNSRIVTYSGGAGAAILTLDTGVVPSGVAVDPAENIYITDTSSNKLLVYYAGATPGTTLLTGIASPVGLAADADADLFIANTTSVGGIELRRSLGAIALPLADVSNGVAQTTTQSIVVNNVGNTALTFNGSPLTSVTGTNSGAFVVTSANSNGCSASVSYSPGADCNFTVSFTPPLPPGTGNFSASAYFNTNAANTGTAYASLTGTGKVLISTVTTLAITSPAAGPYYYGQSFLLTAGLTPNSLITSNGSQTFTYSVNSVSQQPVNTSVTTLTLTPQAGPESVTVTYNSDGTYATSSATQSFTVLPAVTTTTLSVAPVNNGGVLTLLFTATVSAPTATGETGTVAFYAGSTLIASVPVNASGVATYTSTALTFSSNSFYAMFTAAATNGATNFTNSTSPTVAPTADFAVAYSSNAVSISQGGVATVNFNVSSVYGGAGAVALSCTGLPANSLCRFAPTSLTVGSSSQALSVLLYTNVSSTLAQNEVPAPLKGTGSTWVFAFGVPFGLGLLFVRRRRAVQLLSVVMIGLLSVAGLSGCNSNITPLSSAITVTPAGTYTVGVVFTGSNGLSTTHTVNVTFTVIPDSGTY